MTIEQFIIALVAGMPALLTAVAAIIHSSKTRSLVRKMGFHE